MTFENSELDVVGSARKVIVTKDDTTIIEGTGNKTVVKSRISQLDSQIIAAENDFDKNNLRERRASLSGKVAVIKVGGATETEIEEKKYRVDDAVAAVKAALADGVVPGGGVTLINLAKTIKVEGNDSVAVGAQILKNALEQPFRILLNNAGLNADEWLPKVRVAQNGFGVDLIEGNKLVDLKKKGIVDPVRVTLEAIQSSVSIAATASTMGALVVEIPKNDKNANEQNPGMNQMM
jgi:chaperonin GroEL